MNRTRTVYAKSPNHPGWTPALWIWISETGVVSSGDAAGPKEAFMSITDSRFRVAFLRLCAFFKRHGFKPAIYDKIRGVAMTKPLKQCQTL